jgi:hypothetical protein
MDLSARGGFAGANVSRHSGKRKSPVGAEAANAGGETAEGEVAAEGEAAAEGRKAEETGAGEGEVGRKVPEGTVAGAGEVGRKVPEGTVAGAGDAPEGAERVETEGTASRAVGTELDFCVGAEEKEMDGGAARDAGGALAAVKAEAVAVAVAAAKTLAGTETLARALVLVGFSQTIPSRDDGPSGTRTNCPRKIFPVSVGGTAYEYTRPPASNGRTSAASAADGVMPSCQNQKPKQTTFFTLFFNQAKKTS